MAENEEKLKSLLMKVKQENGRLGFDSWGGKIPWRRKIATHSSIVTLEIPWTKEPGGLSFKGSQRVEHN